MPTAAVRLAVLAIVLLIVQGLPVRLVGAELQSRTIAAFDRYVRATEAQASQGPFLWVDDLQGAERGAKLDAARQGGLVQAYTEFLASPSGKTL